MIYFIFISTCITIHCGTVLIAAMPSNQQHVNGRLCPPAWSPPQLNAQPHHASNATTPPQLNAPPPLQLNGAPQLPHPSNVPPPPQLNARFSQRKTIMTSSCFLTRMITSYFCFFLLFTCTHGQTAVEKKKNQNLNLFF